MSSPCSCPAGFSRCAGRCLRRLDQAVTYAEAERLCTQLGAHLAVPRSEQENQCATSATGGARVWLGISDAITETQFVGADGCGPVPVDDPAWADGQPNDYGGQDYLALVPPADRLWAPGWHDQEPEETMFTLCQLPSCYQITCP